MSPASARFEETAIHDAGGETSPLFASSDGRMIFWFRHAGGGSIEHVVDGVAGEPVDAMALDDDRNPALWWSPDGRHFAWSGSRRGRYLVCVDGREHEPFESLSEDLAPTFSPDGGRVAYAAYIGGRPRPVVDGTPTIDHGLEPIRAAFSADGRRLAWVGREGVGTAARERVVLDDGVGPPHGRVIENREFGTGLTFSPDGRRFAYAASDMDGQRVVVDAMPGPGRLEVAFPAFSPDGSRFVHVARFEDGWSLIEGEETGPRFHLVAEPVFTADSRRLAYGAFLDEDHRASVIDGEVGPPFADIWVPGTGWMPGSGPGVFSPDGTRVAYMGQRRSRGLFGGERVKWTPIIDGQVGDEVDELSSAVIFSHDGRSTAFGGRTGNDWRVVVDGRPGPSFRTVLTPDFSPAGHLAYGALAGDGWTVAVDHRQGPRATDINWSGHVATSRPFLWTAAGDAVAWVGAIDGAWRPIVGDSVGPAFSDVKNPFPIDDRTIGFWATRDQTIYRVTATRS